jgi:hypothetical protein
MHSRALASTKVEASAAMIGVVAEEVKAGQVVIVVVIAAAEMAEDVVITVDQEGTDNLFRSYKDR